MIIYFGLELNDQVYSKTNQANGGIHYLGPQTLLYFLESHLGLVGWPNNNEHLRIEQFRQAMNRWRESHPKCFFASSFAADQFATATATLALRDELILTGWNFIPEPNCPERLQCLAGIEKMLNEVNPTDLFNPEDLSLAPGYADRFILVLKKLVSRKIPFEKVYLVEPLDLLPSYLQKTFSQFQSQGITVELLEVPSPVGKTDLGNFQQFIRKQGGTISKKALQRDGSLLILKTKRETEAAAWLARALVQNADFNPLCLIPEKNRTLDNALIQEGLPSLGIQSASSLLPRNEAFHLSRCRPTFIRCNGSVDALGLICFPAED